jgi:hypothetical protein
MRVNPPEPVTRRAGMRRFRILAGSIALTAALLAPATLTPAAPAQAYPTVVIPTCAQMISKSAWRDLFPTGMRLSSDTVRTGASNARLAEIITTNGHRNCTWTDATGLRSITVSVAWIDNIDRDEIRAWYAARGIRLFALGGGPEDFAFVAHKPPRVEMHYTSRMFFIAIDDRSFGSLGGSMQDAYANLVRLNPWMLTL